MHYLPTLCCKSSAFVRDIRHFLHLIVEDVSNENATFETKCRKVIVLGRLWGGFGDTLEGFGEALGGCAETLGKLRGSIEENLEGFGETLGGFGRLWGGFQSHSPPHTFSSSPVYIKYI